ncbi:MAG: ferrous iron transport protein A [Promethearchaeota archaeon]
MKVIKNISKNKTHLNLSSTSLLKCLTECNKGEIVEVVIVNAGFKAKRRLANLGIVPGVKIKKKKAAPLRGPLEIIVKGSSLVIGRGLAEKIIVKCAQECNI